MLRKNGLSIWVDWENILITTNWWQEVQVAIENANTFILIISPNSIRSKYCCAEVAYAIQHSKQLIPIVFRNVPKNLWEQVFGSDEGIFGKDEIITYKQGQNLTLSKVGKILTGYEWISFETTDDLNIRLQKLINLTRL